MTHLVVAMNSSAAAAYVRRERLKGPWLAVTPDTYRAALTGRVGRQERFVWDFDSLRPMGSWSLPADMLDAIRARVSGARP